MANKKEYNEENSSIFPHVWPEKQALETSFIKTNYFWGQNLAFVLYLSFASR